MSVIDLNVRAGSEGSSSSRFFTRFDAFTLRSTRIGGRIYMNKVFQTLVV